jgi:magnesium chelatase subunit D
MTDPASAALGILATDPSGVGGIVLRARPSPAREAFLAALPGPRRRLHPAVDDAALTGGIDAVASIAEGRLVRRPGILAVPGSLVLAMAERAGPGLAARLARAAEAGTHCVVALDEGAEPEEGAPEALTEALGLGLDLDPSWRGGPPRAPGGPPAALPEDAMVELVRVAAALGIPSLRAPLLACRAARAHAGWAGRPSVEEPDLEAAAALVLAPRARTLPEEARPPEALEAPDGRGETEGDGEARGDVLLDAVRAALPPGLLEALAARRRAAGSGAGAGARRTGATGRPLPSRPGRPSRGRVDAAATLRAAAPWQRLRREAPGAPDRPLLLRPSDLRVERRQERAERLVLLVVDASGSAAAARLAEAKGAAEELLARAYAARDRVALVTFRGASAELALPPTRSLARARRLLAGLPGGGGTPLAAGLLAARALAEQARGRGQTPALVVMTDGRANVTLAGEGSRAEAEAEVLALARRMRDAGPSVVVDTATRPGRARALADAMGAQWMPLPRSGGLSEAVRGAIA